MTPEEKELLLKDLYGRLPHNIRVQYKGKCYNVLGVGYERLILSFPGVGIPLLEEQPFIGEVKPYLFPLTSITAEQIEELNKILKMNEDAGDWIKANEVLGIKLFLPTGIWVEHLESLFEWFDKNHFDYRYLIEKGLAIDATGKNIY